MVDNVGSCECPFCKNTNTGNPYPYRVSRAESKVTPNDTTNNGMVENALKEIRLIRSTAMALVDTCDAVTWRLKEALRHYKEKIK